MSDSTDTPAAVEVAGLIIAMVEASSRPAEDIKQLFAALARVCESPDRIGDVFASKYDQLRALDLIHQLGHHLGLRGTVGRRQVVMGGWSTDRISPEEISGDRTAAMMRAQADKEPDPVVRAKVLEAAAQAEAAEARAR